MATLNKIQIIGRVGKDPEMRYSPSGTPVTNLSVAVDRKGKSDQAKKPDWFSVVAFNGTAEFLNKYIGKGRLIYVEGRMQQNHWETDDGQKRTSWELVASQVEPLDSHPQVDDCPI